MKRPLVLIGESGSGKTTLIAELVRTYPDVFKKVVTCTSRQKRAGEMDGVDYHFLPSDHFADNADLVLVKKTEDGTCYGTNLRDLRSDTHFPVLTLRPVGVLQLAALGFRDITLIRLSISESLKVERMLKRGDSEEDILARVQSDIADVSSANVESISPITLDAAWDLQKKIELVLRACQR